VGWNDGSDYVEMCQTLMTAQTTAIPTCEKMDKVSENAGHPMAEF
jgi:hypothetical protein